MEAGATLGHEAVGSCQEQATKAERDLGEVLPPFPAGHLPLTKGQLAGSSGRCISQGSASWELNLHRRGLNEEWQDWVLQKWHSGNKHLLLFQRTLTGFSAPVSRGSQ